MEAIIGKSYLTEIPHEGKTISFQYPAFRGTYGDVAEQIDKDNLKRPTSSETASLVYDAFQNPEGEYESKIIKILRTEWLWEFTGNLYLPKGEGEIQNGVILDLNPKITDKRLNMNKKSLIKRLYEGDKSVKFVPFGYKTEDQSPFKLIKNPYVLARYGEEGAEKIAEIASKCKYRPYLGIFDFVNKEIVTMSVLRCMPYDRLEIGSCYSDDDGDGYAFGVLR